MRVVDENGTDVGFLVERLVVLRQLPTGEWVNFLVNREGFLIEPQRFAHITTDCSGQRYVCALGSACTPTAPKASLSR